MANKHITNPCFGSGMDATQDDSLQWIDPRTNSIKTPCPLCNQLVSIGKANKKLRSHNNVKEREIERDEEESTFSSDS
jgi:hypothetical protein